MPLERRAVLAATSSTLALGVAGCLGDEASPGGDETTTTGDAGTTTGGGDGGQMTGAETTTDEMDGGETTTDASAGATVQVRSLDEHGDVLVGPDGMTLYMFDKDSQGDGASACTDSCASAWPPLTVDDDQTASDDVTASLSTFEREDGSTQVAANGWPLYYFAQDEDPGDAKGQGVGDVWWVLAPDGTPLRAAGTTTTGDGTTTDDGTTTGAETTTDDGGGYGGGGGYGSIR